MVTRKKLKEKYCVAFWKEYSFKLKSMAWICVKEHSGDFVYEAKTLKEIECFLSSNTN